MKILLAGATGYIGSALLPALVTAGHSVTALVRDETKALAVRGKGAATVVGDITDRALVTQLASAADAVVTVASPGGASSKDDETAFAEAVLEGLGSGKTFVRTGGIWVHGPGVIDEDTPRDAPALTAWREAVDTRVLRAPGIRSILIEPGIVYGHGGGIPTVAVAAARAGTFVGPGTQHWTTVHVDDLAELYVAALERAEPGSAFFGVGGDNPTTREIGEAVARRLGLQGVGPETAESLVRRLGLFGEALLLDQQATGEKARTVLSWKPSRPSLLEDIADGSYDA
ncbi:NAD-dependent epimerase/dehydratase family protein [Actinoplanes sp. NPDC000266]